MIECNELTEGRLVSWVTEDGAHHTGRIMRGGGCVMAMPDDRNCKELVRLVRESYTQRLVYVAMSALRDYPSEPIPEPTK